MFVLYVVSKTNSTSDSNEEWIWLWSEKGDKEDTGEIKNKRTRNDKKVVEQYKDQNKKEEVEQKQKRSTEIYRALPDLSMWDFFCLRLEALAGKESPSADDIKAEFWKIER